VGAEGSVSIGQNYHFESLAFFKIIYQCANLVIPDNVVNDTEKIALKSVWAGNLIK
jgi:hypothetical protein